MTEHTVRIATTPVVIVTHHVIKKQANAHMAVNRAMKGSSATKVRHRVYCIICLSIQ